LNTLRTSCACWTCNRARCTSCASVTSQALNALRTLRTSCAGFTLNTLRTS
jgi:hypothetical protein